MKKQMEFESKAGERLLDEAKKQLEDTEADLKLDNGLASKIFKSNAAEKRKKEQKEAEAEKVRSQRAAYLSMRLGKPPEQI